MEITVVGFQGTMKIRASKTEGGDARSTGVAIWGSPRLGLSRDIEWVLTPIDVLIGSGETGAGWNRRCVDSANGFDQPGNACRSLEMPDLTLD